LELPIASSHDRLPLVLVAAVVVVVVFDVTDGDDETVCGHRFDWKSPFSCVLLYIGKKLDVATQMIMETSCRLWPLLFFSVELGVT
jgi:hypothetical protein